MFRHLGGWKKDRHDLRDSIHRPTGAIVPDSYTLAQYLPSVRDQGSLGACTGFGIGGNLTGMAIQLGVYVEWMSPEWIYNGGRLLEGDLNQDGGCEPRFNLDFIAKNGCLLEHYRPYKDVLDTTDPTTWGDGQYAAQWPIVTYSRIDDGVANICSAISEGRFVSLGAPWFQSWMDTGSGGILKPDYSDLAGGHETFLYGYDKTKGVFYGQNSWGTGWGAKGRYVMPMGAIGAFKANGGYDAHYISVNWTPPTPTPTPPPTPVKDNWYGMVHSTDGKLWKLIYKTKA